MACVANSGPCSLHLVVFQRNGSVPVLPVRGPDVGLRSLARIHGTNEEDTALGVPVSPSPECGNVAGALTFASAAYETMPGKEEEDGAE